MASTAKSDMTSALGPYSMSREGSGTSWQPDATPMDRLHVRQGEWSVMAHGLVNVIYDKQSGPRGDDKAFTQSMAMLMGNRPLGRGTLGLRAMVSLDPTMGKSGYPLLFQTGETADGATPLVDRQHPHDFFMELAASYSVKLGTDGAAFAYFGLPASPRSRRTPSCTASPECASRGTAHAPLARLDAHHFRSRDPRSEQGPRSDRSVVVQRSRARFGALEHRDAPIRLLVGAALVQPAARAVNAGQLRRPEEPGAARAHHARQADDGVDQPSQGDRRRRLGDDAGLRSQPEVRRGPRGFRARLAARVHLRDARHAHLLRTRRAGEKRRALRRRTAAARPEFDIRKLSVGYIHDVASTGPVKWGIGGLLGFIKAPSQLDPSYGSSPRSYMLFVQGRL
jgi:hypothetical protein